MFLIGNLQFVLIIFFIIEIRNQERSAMSLHDTSEIFQGDTDISTLAVGMEIQHFPNDIKNMFSSLLRRNILFYSVREKDNTYLIIILNSAEG